MSDTRHIPVIEDVSFEDLLRDPYPTYARARETAAVVRIAAANLMLVTRFDDILAIERDTGTFSSVNPESNVVRLFGTNLMRKDDAAHRRERQAVDASLRPGPVKRCWAPRFAAIVDGVLDKVPDSGQADLFDAVAAPVAGRMLAEVIGFADTDWRTIARWSQAMIDGSGNYSGDPQIERLALEAGREIEAACDRCLAHAEALPPESMLVSMQRAGLTASEIHGNAKVAVGGGFNEPRDALLSLVLGLLTNRDQLACVLADPGLWPAAFEEAVRWIAPIGMYPRKLTQDALIGGIAVPPGSQIGLSVAAANREPARFPNPDRYDLFRPKSQHLAFGSGPHFCAGTWVARALVAGVAAPRLFAKLRNLRLIDDHPVLIRGWVFRGPTSLPVCWDA